MDTEIKNCEILYTSISNLRISQVHRRLHHLCRRRVPDQIRDFKTELRHFILKSSVYLLHSDLRDYIKVIPANVINPAAIPISFLPTPAALAVPVAAEAVPVEDILVAGVAEAVELEQMMLEAV